MHITATSHDRAVWFTRIKKSHSMQEMLAVLDSVWEDGYRSAEAEITYAVTPE